jgi:hypothetical protein
MKMPLDRFLWHVNKLVEVKKEEREAMERAHKNAERAAKRSRRR